MKKRNMLVIGMLGMLLAIGAISIAMARNTSTSSEKINETESNKCTPEMMKNIKENCPEQMMQSGACESMMNTANKSSMGAGCSVMMSNGTVKNTKTSETNETSESHCGNMGSDMG